MTLNLQYANKSINKIFLATFSEHHWSAARVCVSIPDSSNGINPYRTNVENRVSS